MNDQRIASKVTIIPSELGEDEFVDAANHPRRIRVNMVAGTINVGFSDGADPAVFAWCAPLVPLSTLTPLVEELAGYVQRALAGTSPCLPHPNGASFTLTDAAEKELVSADRLVAAFYRRWTGRKPTTQRSSRCVKCGNRIIDAVNLADDRWVTDIDDHSACAQGGEHEPTPFGQPHAPRALVPEHEMALDQAPSGAWTATCECGTWEQAGPTWEPVAVAHFLHAEAIPPDAPFDL